MPMPHLLPGVSDLERAVARLHASTVAGAGGRDAAHVVLYEDASKKKVRLRYGVSLYDSRTCITIAAHLQRRAALNVCW